MHFYFFVFFPIFDSLFSPSVLTCFWARGIVASKVMDDDLSNVDMSTKIHSLWQLIEIDAQEKKKTHNAKNINKCNQCEHEFDNPCSLEIHLKNHIGEMLYNCNQCDYASSRAGNLRKHLKTHSGEKSNNCNQCDYKSLHAAHLRTHMNTHSGAKVKQMQPM